MEQAGDQKVPAETGKMPVGSHKGEMVSHHRPMGSRRLLMGVHKGLLCATRNRRSVHGDVQGASGGPPSGQWTLTMSQ